MDYTDPKVFVKALYKRDLHTATLCVNAGQELFSIPRVANIGNSAIHFYLQVASGENISEAFRSLIALKDVIDLDSHGEYYSSTLQNLLTRSVIYGSVEHVKLLVEAGVTLNYRCSVHQFEDTVEKLLILLSAGWNPEKYFYDVNPYKDPQEIIEVKRQCQIWMDAIVEAKRMLRINKLSQDIVLLLCEFIYDERYLLLVLDYENPQE